MAGESAGRDHIELLLEVARAYYDDDRGQAEIARDIGYSRSTVSRLLTEARARGVVRILIAHPLERQMALEKALIERFGLRSARVAGVEPDLSPLTSVAQAGAEVLVEACRRATVLATSAGTTIHALVQELPLLALRELHVVQMIGSLARSNPHVDSIDTTRRIAERLGGDYRLMPAPLIVGSARLARALRHEEAVANAIALASHADVALVGIGAMSAQGVSGEIFAGWLTPEESAMLVRLGAVGHLSGHHFDAQGRHIRTELCDRVMSVPLERLREIRSVIGVATGEEKVAAIVGAVRGGYLDVLVTDAPTAQAVLRADEAAAASR